MKTNVFRVVSQGDVSYIPSTKQEGGQLAKCEIRLKMLGGSKFGDEFIATIFGRAPLLGSRGKRMPVSGCGM